MRMFATNLIDAAATVLSSSSADANYPLANLKNELRGLLWKTGVAVALEYVVFDLGSAQAVTSFIILDHDLLGTETLVKIQGNATDSWGAPTFSQTITVVVGAPITTVFASQSFRYWRFTFTKPAAANTRQFGRLFLGVYQEFTEAPDFDGFAPKDVDLSARQRTTGGQIYSDVRDMYRMFALDYPVVPQASVDILRGVVRTVGMFKSFFCQITPGSSGEIGEQLYVKFAKLPEPKVSAFDSSLHYDFRVELEEVL